jgi:hypothetical protein
MKAGALIMGMTGLSYKYSCDSGGPSLSCQPVFADISIAGQCRTDFLKIQYCRQEKSTDGCGKRAWNTAPALTNYCLPPKSAVIVSKRGRALQLVCEKHKDKVDPDDPVCRHPYDYCQFRTSCIIHFMEKENQREQARKEKKKQCGND